MTLAIWKNFSKILFIWKYALNLVKKFLWVCFQVNVPVFTLPMTLVTLVLINVTDERGRLYRVEDMSYPEKQSYQWHTSMRVKTTKV